MVSVGVSITPEILSTPSWRRHEQNGVTLFLSGHVWREPAELAELALHALRDGQDVSAELAGLDGHFALIALWQGYALAVVDRIRSVPIAFAQDGAAWRIDPVGGRLARDLDLTAINQDGALAIAMAGYTIGRDTVYAGLQSLVAGEAVLWRGGEPERLRYDRYCAWKVIDRPEPELQQALCDVTLDILRKLIRRADGRMIAIPLSAGLDSRLIASGLKHLGYGNVRLFSYGQEGNHEALAAQRIAATLGYEWRFVPTTHRAMSRFYASPEHASYLAYADSGLSCPFEQDLFPVLSLLRDGWITSNTIVVNGNSGDYISGAHVLGPLQTVRHDLDSEALRDLICTTLTAKHFRLWQSLATPANDTRIKLRLAREIAETGVEITPEGAHGIYEYCEFQDRQSKYVVSGQRVYEFVGLEWALPLWDVAYIDFWQGVPLRLKVKQQLYRNMLRAENWGGVWTPDFTVPKNIVPRWIRLPRLVLKALHAPLGRKRWHRFERRYLTWWLTPTAISAAVPWLVAARDRRGARHAVAWHTESWLRTKGIPLEQVGS